MKFTLADAYNHQSTPQSVRTAIALAPGNSAYLQHAAELDESAGGDGTPLRIQATQANPADAANWIRIATHEELQNQSQAAERDFQRAYEADHQYEPRWALANFYFRRGDTNQSLVWARKAIDFGRGDLNAVFDLCWNTSGNGAEILNKAIPRRPAIMTQYVRYLDNSGRLDEATQAIATLMPLAGPGEASAILEHCTRSLKTGDADSAIAAWNGLVERKLLEAGPVDPRAGKSLINAQFQHAFTGQGFDWEPRKVDGVSLQRLPSSSALRVDLSGTEPETCIMLGQYIVLMPDRGYRFRAAYDPTGMTGAGMQWVIYDAATNAVLITAGPSEANVASHVIDARFQTPLQTHLARLELRYLRALGTVRPVGSITFSHLALEPVE